MSRKVKIVVHFFHSWQGPKSFLRMISSQILLGIFLMTGGYSDHVVGDFLEQGEDVAPSYAIEGQAPHILDDSNIRTTKNKKSASFESTRMQADLVEYDEVADKVYATGHVEISRLGTVLFADKLTYDRKADRIFVEGNVWLRTPKGHYSKTEAFEISGDLKEGSTKAIGGIMSDNGRFVALSSQRLKGKENQFESALYSPCELCNARELEPPTWQIRSRRMIHDEESDTIKHVDATLEMKGVPVLYVPYLHHPGPKTKRKSGLLPLILGTQMI